MKRLLLVFLLLLCACQTHPPAPVVNAWLQPNQTQSSYIVRGGDTIYSIAWQFGLNYQILAKQNHLQPPYKIYVGQHLEMTTIARGEEPVSVSQIQSHPATKKLTVQKIHNNVTPAIVDDTWRWPARGKVISQFDPRLGGNLGINIAGLIGSPVRAARAGKVVYCGNGIRGYGNMIIIKHDQHYLSAYAYNQKLLVKLGQVVHTGEMIGTMGKDDAGQVMLHFEVRSDGRPVNPLKVLF